jgi:hypothetical protein
LTKVRFIVLALSVMFATSWLFDEYLHPSKKPLYMLLPLIVLFIFHHAIFPHKSKNGKNDDVNRGDDKKQ